MRDRGKREVEATYNNGGFYGGEGLMEFPCKKHPASSSTSSAAGGICAYCLTDRLYQLVCPQCGEQRLSSCSCTTTTTTSDLFSSNNLNSSSSADVGSVGRISFLLENDKVNTSSNRNSVEISSTKAKMEQRYYSTSNNNNVDDYASLRRSNSTCVTGEVNAASTVGRKESSKDKFWKIGRLFRKKREKPNNHNHNLNQNQDQDQSNNFECNGVSRSRSLCSFRGFYDSEECGNNFPVSSSSAARASSVSTGNFYADSAKMSCFSESEARISNFDYFDPNSFIPNKNNIFSLKETEFMSCDDPAYIDLKLHEVSSSDQARPNHYSAAPDLAGMRRNGLGQSTKEFSFRGNNDHHNHEMFRNGSCRRSSVTERELRKCRKSYKVLRWFFRHQTSSRGTDDHDHQDHQVHHHQHHQHNHAFNS